MTHHDVHMYDAEVGGWFMKSNHRLGPIIHGFMVHLVSHYTHPLSCWNAGGAMDSVGLGMNHTHYEIDQRTAERETAVGIARWGRKQRGKTKMSQVKV